MDAAVRLAAGLLRGVGREGEAASGRSDSAMCWRCGSGRSRGGGGSAVLLLGHLDTVWPLGTLKKMPWRERETSACGGRACWI